MLAIRSTPRSLIAFNYTCPALHELLLLLLGRAPARYTAIATLCSGTSFLSGEFSLFLSPLPLCTASRAQTELIPDECHECNDSYIYSTPASPLFSIPLSLSPSLFLPRGVGCLVFAKSRRNRLSRPARERAP